MTSTPGLDLHRRAHTYCAFCPKLCRFACPVATEEASETTTPWAKMTTLHHVAQGDLSLTESHAASFYACTGCLRCRSYCDHDNEVAAALGAGRAEAVKRGLAPAAAFEVIEGYSDGVRDSTRRARELWGEADARATTGYVPGDAALRDLPDEARAGYGVVETLVGRAPRPLVPGPGLDLLEAGDEAGFAAAAARFLEAARGLSRVVFLDPDALYAARHIAPQFGLTTTTPLVHLSELADAHLGRLRPLRDLGDPARHRYLDPCKLGRGLGVYDAPRRVLARVLGGPVGEPHLTREVAECSGAGGLLPQTRPETAGAIARARVEDHRRAQGAMLVVACPSAQVSLGRQGGADVVGFASLVARSLVDAAAPRP